MKKKILKNKNNPFSLNCYSEDIECFNLGTCHNCDVLSNVLKRKDNEILKLKQNYSHLLQKIYQITDLVNKWL